MDINTLTRAQLAGMMDHTFLKAYAEKSDLEKLCEEAREHGFAMVVINSVSVKLCKELLAGCDVHVGAVISFQQKVVSSTSFMQIMRIMKIIVQSV